MLEFIFGPDGIRSQRINLIWLGLNPNFYKHLLTDEEHTLNNLHISEICDRIINSGPSLRLNVLSNLLRGACMIHKAQVDFLYSKTKHLYSYQNNCTLDLSFFSEEDSIYKKSKIQVNKRQENYMLFDAQSIYEETENLNCELVEDNSFSDNEANIELTTCREADITLKEENKHFGNYFNSVHEDEELFDLGEMTNNEKEIFSEIINLNTKGRVNKTKLSKTIFKAPQKNVEDSFEELRNASISENQSLNRTQLNSINESIIEVLDKNILDINISHNSPNNINDKDINNLPILSHTNHVLPDLPGYNDFIQNINDKNYFKINNKQEDQQLTQMNLKISNNEIKRRKTMCKIDKVVEMKEPQIVAQLQNFSIFRCIHPRQEIVQKSRFRLKSSEKLFSTSCLKLRPPLFVYFKRNLKRKKEMDDFHLINDILNAEESQHIVFDNLLNKRRRLNSDSLKVSNTSSLMKPLPVNECRIESEFDQANLIECLQNDSRVEIVDTNLSKIELCTSKLTKILEETENLTNINLNEYSIPFAKIKTRWSQSAVFHILSRFWLLKVDKITMELLCENVSKQEAAIAFSSIIQLSAKNYINIIKKEDTNIIHYITMGEYVTSMLNN